MLCISVNSNADDTKSKLYSKDEGIVSIMYHRFNESKYPSTNIQMNVFKQHINIIKESKYEFYYPNEFEKNFDQPKKKRKF